MTAEAVRRAHGTAAKGGRLLVTETLPANELPPATPVDTVQPERDGAGRFLRGNTTARSKRLRPGPRGHLGDLEALAAAAWKASIRFGRRGSAHVRRRWAELHGGQLGEVPSLMVDRAFETYADATYLRALGRSTGKVDLVLEARDLERKAEQSFKDAWYLAAKEAEKRPSTDADEPWFRKAGAP